MCKHGTFCVRHLLRQLPKFLKPPISFELFRSDGVLLGSESLLLMPYDNNQLNRIFDPYHPVVGYVDYWSAATSGRVWCYGSVLDNVTSDPTTVPPQ